MGRDGGKYMARIQDTPVRDSGCKTQRDPSRLVACMSLRAMQRMVHHACLHDSPTKFSNPSRSALAPEPSFIPQNLLPCDPASGGHEVQPVRQHIATQRRVPAPDEQLARGGVGGA